MELQIPHLMDNSLPLPVPPALHPYPCLELEAARESRGANGNSRRAKGKAPLKPMFPLNSDCWEVLLQGFPGRRRCSEASGAAQQDSGLPAIPVQPTPPYGSFLPPLTLQ